MGVDCRINLPADVRLSDVAEAIGILLGCKPERHDFDRGGWCCRVPGAETTPASVDTCAEIKIKPPKGEPRWFLYHFEVEYDGRLIMPRATDVNIALGRRLVQFFGGRLDYNDCDSTDWNEAYDRPRPRNNPSDGAEWDSFQAEMMELKPLTPTEIKKAKGVASY